MEYKLEDLIEIKHGYAFKSEDFSEEPTRNILLSPGNVSIGGGFNSRKKKYYREDIEVNRNYVFSNGDVFITMTDLSKEGDTLGYPAKIPENTNCNYLHNQRLGKVILKNEKLIDLDYLYYLLCTREYRGYILGTATGSTVKHTSPTKILDYKINLPELHVQKKVSSILSSLDKKILVNNKTIELLEQLSQTLFKQWFIHFEFPNEEGEPYKSSGGAMIDSELKEIPLKWRVGVIDDIAYQKKTKVNLDKTSIEFNYIGLEHMPQGSIALSNWESSNKVSGNKNAFSEEDILFGKLRPYFKKVGIASIEGVCSTDIVVINTEKSYLKSYLLLTLLQDDFIQYTSNTATGTRMPRTSWKLMSNYKIVLPDELTLIKFEDAISPLFRKISHLIHENNNLQQLRNALLPKLLSDEIEISNDLKV